MCISEDNIHRDTIHRALGYTSNDKVRKHIKLNLESSPSKLDGNYDPVTFLADCPAMSFEFLTNKYQKYKSVEWAINYDFPG